MGARGHATRGVFGGQQRAERVAAADALGHQHDVGRDPGPFMGEELARPPHAALDLVEDQQKPVFVAEIAQALEADIGQRADAAFALHGLDHDGAHVGCGGGGAQGVVIAEGQLAEARQERPEALGQLLRSGGRDRGHGAAVKGALEGQDRRALGLLALVAVLARHLDGQFRGLCPGIAEEDRVGEGVFDQPLGQRLLLGGRCRGSRCARASRPGP